MASYVEELIARAPVVAFVKDAEGRYLYVNDGWLCLFPLRRDEVLGRTDVELFGAPVAGDLEKNDRRVLETGEVLEVEELAPVDGVLRTYLSTKFPLGDGEDRAVGGIAIDISGRQQALAALASSEAKFRELVTHSPEAYMVMDLDAGRFVDANENAAKLFGLSLPQLLKKGVPEVSPPTQPNGMTSERAARLRIEEALRGNSPVFDWVHLSAQGELLPCRIWLAAVDLGGRKGVRASVIDMREVDHARDALSVARAELDSVQNALPQMVAVVDPESGEVLHRNSAYKRMMEKVENVDWLANTELIQSAQTDGQAQGDVSLVRRDGSEFLLDLRVSVFRKEGGGELPRLLFVGEDVTEERATELKQREAKRLQSLGRLAGGVAHDFNNLLTVILYSAEFLEQSVSENPAASEDLKVLVNAAEQAQGLTSQLLAFAREEGGEARAVEVDTMLPVLVQMLERLLGEDVILSVDLQAPGARVWIDVGQLEQMIINLAVNARDAMKPGGTLRLRTAFVSCPGPNGKKLELTVSDTGCGMSAEVREKVFEPFFTTKEVGRGTGLGLSTVYGIVQRASGDILLESREGVGTSVRILFPVHEGPPPESLRPPAAQPRAQGQRILVVEDDAAVRQVTARALSNAGFVVHSAEGPLDALARAGGLVGKVDAIVSDIVMPEMSGLELRGRLAQVLGDLPTVFVSGYSADALAQRGVDRREIVLVEKPFKIEDLVHPLLSALANEGSPKSGG